MKTTTSWLATLLLLALPGALSTGFAQTYNYTTLINPFSITEGGATIATGISGGTIVGSYNIYNSYNGNGSAGFTLIDGVWTSIQLQYSTLNRTDIYGISGDTIVATIASGEPEPHQSPDTWNYIYGYVGETSGGTRLSDPHVNPSKSHEGTKATALDINDGVITVAGFWLNDQDEATGYLWDSSSNTYSNLPVLPSGIDNGRIVGRFDNQDLEVTYGYIYENSASTLFLAPSSQSTIFTAISGDLIVGTAYYDSGPDQGFIYNLATEEWTMLNSPAGALGVYPRGIDGTTIVGSYTVSYDGGLSTLDYAFVAAPVAVPEPSTTSALLGGLLLYAVVWRARTRRRAG